MEWNGFNGSLNVRRRKLLLTDTPGTIGCVGVYCAIEIYGLDHLKLPVERNKSIRQVRVVMCLFVLWGVLCT